MVEAWRHTSQYQTVVMTEVSKEVTIGRIGTGPSGPEEWVWSIVNCHASIQR